MFAIPFNTEINNVKMPHHWVSIGLIMKLSYVIVKLIPLKRMCYPNFFSKLGTIDIHIWDTAIRKNGVIVLLFTLRARNS